jgi:hypothetical protein
MMAESGRHVDRTDEIRWVFPIGSSSDTIRIMAVIHIESVAEPFDEPDAARRAARIISTADAMGLLGDLEVAQLNLAAFREIVDRIAAAGIGLEVRAALAANGSAVDGVLLRRLAEALEASPVPEHEWDTVGRLFPVEELEGLLDVSAASVRRYRAGERSTPDVVADRLHFLATVVGDLAGSYNTVGIRRWFHRRRQALGGRAPAELMDEGWLPEDEGPAAVRRLARSLLGAPAT